MENKDTKTRLLLLAGLIAAFMLLGFGIFGSNNDSDESRQQKVRVVLNK